MIYFDQAATTFPKPKEVYDYADQWYREFGGNPGRGMNPLSRKGLTLLSDVRKELLNLFQIKKYEQILLFPSVTVAINQAILGLDWEPGDTFVLSPFEHNAVARCANKLKQDGIQIECIPYANGELQLEKFIQLLQIKRPKLVAHMRTSNVTGDMFNVESIGKLTKQYSPDSVFLVDDAQTAGLYPISIQESKIDLYAFSGHKSLYGPTGIAGLINMGQVNLTPLLYGGTGTRSESLEMPEELPDRFEIGSHNVYALAGLYASLRWMQETGRDQIRSHIQQLTDRFKTGVQQIIGIDHKRYLQSETTGIVALTFFNVSSQEAETFLGGKDICVRAGIHCAPLMHRSLGTLDISGVTRFSFGYFNTFEEVDRVLDYIDEVIDL